MATILAQLLLQVSVGPAAAPDARLQVFVQGTPSPPDLPLDVTLDVLPLQAALGIIKQVAGFVVFLGTEELPLQNLLAEMSVDMSLDSFLATWKLAAPLPGPFGVPNTWLGASPGDTLVSIYGVYLTPSGRTLIPLIVNGMVDTEDREFGSDGRVTRLTGVDTGGRWDHYRITLLLPPGHGLTRDQVAAKIGSLMGMPTACTSTGLQMMKEVQMIDADWYSPLQEMYVAEGQRLLYQNGALTNIPQGFYAGGVNLRLTEANILSASAIQVSARGEVITRMIVTGQQQLAKSQAHTTTTETVSGSSIYAPKTAVFKQSGDKSLVSLSSSGPAPLELRKTSSVVTIREYEYDTLLSEVVLTYAYYNPISARYLQAGDGSTTGVEGVFLYEAGATAGDNSQAYLWPAEQFVLVSHQETVYNYDDTTGFLISTVQRSESPALGQADLMSRANTTTPWESATFTNGRFLLGNGNGVVGLPSTLEPDSPVLGHEVLPSAASIEYGAERSITTTTNELLVITLANGEKRGFVNSKAVVTQGYTVQQGFLHLYAGSQTYAAATVTFQELSEVDTSYTATNESSHNEIAATIVNGVVTGTELQEGVPGYLPAATQSLDLIPSSSIYANPTEATAAAAASRFDNVPIRAEYISTPLENAHVRNDARQTSQWAENVDECLRIAQEAVLEGAATPVKLSLPANFFIQRGWILELTINIQDFDLVGLGVGEPVIIFVRQVSHRLAGPNGPVTTDIVGHYYYAT